MTHLQGCRGNGISIPIPTGFLWEFPQNPTGNPTETHRKSHRNPQEIPQKPTENPTEAHRKSHRNPQEIPQKPTGNPTDTHRISHVGIPIGIKSFPFPSHMGICGFSHGNSHRFPFPRQPCGFSMLKGGTGSVHAPCTSLWNRRCVNMHCISLLIYFNAMLCYRRY